MKTLILCFSLFIVFGAIQGYVLERRIPLHDQELLKDILKLNRSLQDPYDFEATVNIFADKIMGNLDNLIKKENLDPLPLGDVYEGHWWGHIKLNGMEVSGISTLYRPEDVIVSYTHDNKQLQLDLPLSFKDLKFNSHFKATLMGIGPGGRITGEVPDILIKTSIVVDFNVNEAFLRTFEIPRSGHIAVHIHDTILADWAVNLISDAVTAIFKHLILNDVGGVVHGLLDDIVDIINQLLQKILG